MIRLWGRLLIFGLAVELAADLVAAWYGRRAWARWAVTIGAALVVMAGIAYISAVSSARATP